ncbi:hypothetical protein [Streptomyces sp. NPDC003720]|uniref:hypothetical protein n=1 Tax=Streptomyces sp. NPDC003720 TaxID=3364684 RepID=UPI00367853AD
MELTDLDYPAVLEAAVEILWERARTGEFTRRARGESELIWPVAASSRGRKPSKKSRKRLPSTQRRAPLNDELFETTG